MATSASEHLEELKEQALLTATNQMVGLTGTITPSMAEQYPGIDIKGKFTKADMDLATRMASVNAQRQLRPKAVQDYIESIENAPQFKALQAKALENSMLSVTCQWAGETLHRQEDVPGAPLAGKDLTRVSARLESSVANSDYAKAVDVLEYFATGKEMDTKQVEKFCKDTLKLPVPKEAERQRKERQSGLVQVAVEFQSDEAQYELSESMDHAPKYCAASVQRVLDPLYEPYKKTEASRHMRRENLILIKDPLTNETKSLRTHMLESGMTPDYFETEQGKLLSGEILSNALNNGMKVCCFTPDGQTGDLKPTLLSQEGYQPVEPVHMNRWEKFWSKRDFYKEKTARYNEYQRYLAAEKDAQENLEKEFAPLLENDALETYEHATEVTKSLSLEMEKFREASLDFTHQTSLMQNSLHMQMFGEVDPEVLAIGGGQSAFHMNRTPESRAMLLLLNQDHTPKEIMDPTCLQAEKAAAGKVFAEMARTEDRMAYAELFYKGIPRFMEHQEFGLNFKSPEDIRDHAAEVLFMRASMDLVQEHTRVRPEMRFLAVNEERKAAKLPLFESMEEHKKDLAERKNRSPEEQEKAAACEARADKKMSEVYGKQLNALTLSYGAVHQTLSTAGFEDSERAFTVGRLAVLNTLDRVVNEMRQAGKKPCDIPMEYMSSLSGASPYMTNLSKTPQTLAKVEKLTLEGKEVLATTVETERGNTIQTTQLKPGLKEEFQKEEKAVEAKQNATKGPAPRAK